MTDSLFEENSRLIVPKDDTYFFKKFGGVFEKSPHFVEKIKQNITNFNEDGEYVCLTKSFHSAVVGAVKSVTKEEKLALINAHPDLGSQINPEKMGADSQSEQKGAGLTDAPEEVKKAFGELNAKYKSKFGFPFILAVRGVEAQDKPAAMLAAMEERIHNDADTEFETALTQIYKIAGFRLSDIADKDAPQLALSKPEARKIGAP